MNGSVEAEKKEGRGGWETKKAININERGECGPQKRKRVEENEREDIW